MRFVVRTLSFLLLFGVVATARAQEALTIISAAPRGEIASLDQARELRVTFSEPMVVLGRVPKERPSYLKITPALPGTTRWSGTTVLIFTPDPKKVPLATKYTVTVDGGAKAVSGRALGKPYEFSFTTPTLRLLSTRWRRSGGKATDPLIFGLSFNQPVDPAALAPHVRFDLVPTEFEKPVIGEKARKRLATADPAALTDFESKARIAAAASQATGNITGAQKGQTDKALEVSGKESFVFETRPVGPGAAIQVTIGPKAPSTQGGAVPDTPQQFTAKLEPMFFVAKASCDKECDPDYVTEVNFTTAVDLAEVRKAITVIDITDPKNERKLTQKKTETPEEDEEEYDSASFTLEDAGYDTEPARTYFVTLARTLRSKDGQSLGYTWGHVFEFTHQIAFSSFGDGHGVWESDGGTVVPFHARNLTSVTQWLSRLDVDQLVPTLVDLQNSSFRSKATGKGTVRKLNVKADQIQSHGFDVTPALGANKKGIVRATLEDGPPISRARRAYDEVEQRSTVVQVTDLGITVKDSPQNTLVFVTRLSTGQPVSGATVSIRTKENKVFWQGTTDATGLAMAENTPIRADEWEFAFVVTAEKDGDLAYVGSDWNDGIQSWDFGHNYSLDEAKPTLRGTVFSDRGVYKIGEELKVKAILRSDTPNGIVLLDRGRNVKLTLTDSQGQTVATTAVPINEWSSTEWAPKVPADSPLGTWGISASVDGISGTVDGSFLVAAYRRPDFRVDATLAAEPQITGATLRGVITSKYLFGAPMGNKPVRWTLTSVKSSMVPEPITNRFNASQWAFLDQRWEWEENEPVVEREGTDRLDKNGILSVDLATPKDAGVPKIYTLEGDVTDTSRQKIAGRTSMLVHPAPWYVGVKRPGYFLQANEGVRSELIVARPDGSNVAGVKVALSLAQVQWHSVRRAEGNGFYTWETERREVPSGELSLTSTAATQPFSMPLKSGGYYVLKAMATDAEGRSTTTLTDFYVDGEGYSAWERYDHNRIDLVAEKSEYKPGETARILIKSPWEAATALITTEREGIRTQRTMKLSSTQETIEVSITERDIPNVYVSVLLIKGRSSEALGSDGSDPGKPAFRLGYLMLKVDDRGKRLAVSVDAQKEEYRPGAKAKVAVQVKDAQGKAAQAEVTLWAVDYGVLSLTNYQTPDVLSSVYVEKALQVKTSDSRQKIISRRVMTPKGAAEGGGGGLEDGPGVVRRDFRVLAFWLGSMSTNAKGEAKAEVTLPESLTTYRIMAVAGDRQSRFGSAEREIRTNKPLLLKQAFPRFMTIGDRASFGSIVHSQLKRGGTAVVTVRSLDPSIIEIVGDTKRNVSVAAGSDTETRFEFVAKASGNARIAMTVKMGDESDAFEDIIPVHFVSSPETVAAYGVATPEAREGLKLPTEVVPTFGGLHIDMASTALVGLGEGARYLVEYPYGCAEQRSSASLALMLAADLGNAFKIPELEGRNHRAVAQAALSELAKFQCADGAIAFWAGDCKFASPYLTAWILHVLQRARALGYTIDDNLYYMAREYMTQQLNNAPRPDNDSWYPAYSAWQSFVIKVLANDEVNVDTHINRLYERLDRMPVFAIAFLDDAMAKAGEKSGPRRAELQRRMRNAILNEAGASHVEELNDPYLLFYWNSNIRSTAIVLSTLVRNSDDPTLARTLVRGLMDARRNGRWGNTQENAWAMEALVDFYKKYESVKPDFAGTASLGTEVLATGEFRGRDAVARSSDIPMQQLLTKGGAGEEKPLVFLRNGEGTLYYTTRLRYASAAATLAALDSGFKITRKYTLQSDKDGKALESFKAGDLIKVTLNFELPKERRFVAVTDPLPAGLEPVESWFATTASELSEIASRDESAGDDWLAWWRLGGFDRVERHDDRVNLFATRLSSGTHVYSYLVRATTSGSFKSGPAHVEEMYRPENFGRSSTSAVTVTP